MDVEFYLKDIVSELKTTGRDIRPKRKPCREFLTEVMTLEDLKQGMVLKGTIRNVLILEPLLILD